MGVKKVAKFKAVIALQDPDVVVPRVGNLEQVGIGKVRPEETKINAVEGIKNVGPLCRPDLNQAEFRAEIVEGIIFRIQGDQRRALQIVLRLFHLGVAVHPQPRMIHHAFLTPLCSNAAPYLRIQRNTGFIKSQFTRICNELLP